MTELVFRSEDIHCDGCAASIRAAVSALAGVDTVEVDVGTKTVRVSYDSPASEEQIAHAIEEAGFGLTR
jgi:copper chaperone CopZ